MGENTETQIEAAAEAIISLAGTGSYRQLARVALEAAEKAAWQPIETAPKDGTGVLLFNPYEEQWVAIGRWLDHIHEDFHYGWNVDQWRDGSEPTHWRPLVDPPHNGFPNLRG
jgi:hypothetical protein